MQYKVARKMAGKGFKHAVFLVCSYGGARSSDDDGHQVCTTGSTRLKAQVLWLKGFSSQIDPARDADLDLTPPFAKTREDFSGM